MAKTMRVRVKDKMQYWYCGKLYFGRDIDKGRMKSDEFYLKEREHSINTNEDGSPQIITVEQQFSKNNMIEVKSSPRQEVPQIEDADFKDVVDEDEVDEADIVQPDPDDVLDLPIGMHPSEMSAKELKAALDDAGIDYPKSSNKKQMIDLLEAHLSGQS